MSHEQSSKKLRTVHIGVGGMGFEDLKAISSHKNAEIVGLCDVGSR
jgi:predicted dehydrogenase